MIWLVFNGGRKEFVLCRPFGLVQSEFVTHYIFMADSPTSSTAHAVDVRVPQRNQAAREAVAVPGAIALDRNDSNFIQSKHVVVSAAADPEDSADNSNDVCVCTDGRLPQLDGTIRRAPAGYVLNRPAVKSNNGGAHHMTKANSSFRHSIINILGMMIGLGLLSAPYALHRGGWMSAFLLAGFGMILAYTATAIGSCLESNPDVANYQDLGERAFGRKGRIIVSAFLYLEIFLALVSYTISLGDNLGTIFLGAHLGVSWVHLPASRFLTIVAVLMALPTVWLRDLSSISFLSSGGIVASLLLLLTVIWVAALGGVGASHRIPALQIHNIPGISGIYIFSYAGHLVFPNVYRAMKHPSQFSKAVAISFSLLTLVYVGLAFMGATMFGSDVKSQITLNMPRRLIATKIALWATVITPMTKYALELAPVAMQLESLLPPWMGSKSRMAIRGMAGSLLLMIILAIALTLPYFGYVLALTGSLLSVSSTIIYPCAFYIKIFGSGLSKPMLALNVAFIIFGVVFGAMGTISSLKSIVISVRESHNR